MQSNCVPFRPPEGTVPQWPQKFNDKLEDGTFILCRYEWPVITLVCICESPAGELSLSVPRLSNFIVGNHHDFTSIIGSTAIHTLAC